MQQHQGPQPVQPRRPIPGQRAWNQIQATGPMLRSYIAETLGSFLAGVGVYALLTYRTDLPGDLATGWYIIPVWVGLAYALGVLLALQVSNVSGHLNPLLTLLRTVLRRLPRRTAAAMIAGQLTGWLVAALIVSSIKLGELSLEGFHIGWGTNGLQLSWAANDLGILSMPRPGLKGMPFIEIFLIEAFLVSILLVVAYNCWRRPASALATAISLGTTVGFLSLLGSLTSGGAINPLLWVTATIWNWSWDWETFFQYFLALVAAVPLIWGFIRYTEPAWGPRRTP